MSGNDNLQRPAFTTKRLEEERAKDKRKVIPTSWNNEELKELGEWQNLILEEREGTAIKQLARIGASVIQEQKVKVCLDVVLNNYRKNKQKGVLTFE